MKMLTISQDFDTKLIYTFNKTISLARKCGRTQAKLTIGKFEFIIHNCSINGHPSWIGQYRDSTIIGRFPNDEKNTKKREFNNISNG